LVRQSRLPRRVDVIALKPGKNQEKHREDDIAGGEDGGESHFIGPGAGTKEARVG
jgi:hypothetical protein